jgi:hypothetical protein
MGFYRFDLIEFERREGKAWRTTQRQTSQHRAFAGELTRKAAGALHTKKKDQRARQIIMRIITEEAGEENNTNREKKERDGKGDSANNREAGLF